jgi:hypothetical protein
MRKLLLLAVVALLITSVGCVMVPGSPVTGGLFTQVKGVGTVVDNSVQPAKQGTAQASGIIVFATGDASVSTAMKNGGITKVHHVDEDYFSVLGFYSTAKTTVYGE